MKRVAHVLWRSRGGIRRHVKTIAANAPAGYETAGIWGPAELAPYFEGFPFHPVTRVSLLLAGRDADLVHAHGITAGTVALRRRRPPVVVTLHVVAGETGRTQRSAFARFVARRIIERSDAVIAVSPNAARDAPHAHVIPPAFHPLPPPGVSRDAVRRSLGVAPNDVVVVAVSRLERSKRLDLFIDAVRNASAKGWIVGDGAERSRLEASARGSGTRLLGYRDDVADILAAADVFALPSESESYGIAVAEAVATGLPVVATRTGAVEEIVGGAGVIVDPRDGEAFMAAVKSLVTDRNERRRAAGRARDAHLDARELIAAVGAVYDQVTQAR